MPTSCLFLDLQNASLETGEKLRKAVARLPRTRPVQIRANPCLKKSNIHRNQFFKFCHHYIHFLLRIIMRKRKTNGLSRRIAQ